MHQPNPTLNGDVYIFRELSRIVADDTNDFDIHLAKPVPEFHFSLTSVSRFYRIDALPSLASSIRYDFGNGPRTLQSFSSVLSPASQLNIRNIKIKMVEGFMLHNEALSLTSDRSLSTYINNTVANLRVLHIDLWPRDPTRTIREPTLATLVPLGEASESTDKTENRAWGVQSEVLLRSLHNVKAKVRLELRLAVDCEKFEREYVRNRGWKRIREKMPENPSNSNGDICYRWYGLHGSGDNEVGRHASEQ